MKRWPGRHPWQSIAFPALLMVALTACSAGTWASGLGAFAEAFAEPADDKVCVTYATSTGWSKGYEVEGTVLKGSELNRRTSTRDYTSYSTYVVVFWGEDQASILKLALYTGSISRYGQDATDQQGRKWRVSRTAYCS